MAASQPLSSGMNVQHPRVLCKCGVPARVRKVATSHDTPGKKLYGCGVLHEKQCEFFQWVEPEERKVCEACNSVLAKTESLSVMVEELQQNMDVQAGKFRFLIDSNNELRAEKNDLEVKLEKVVAQSNRHMRGKNYAYCCLVATWIAVVFWVCYMFA